MKAEVSSPSAFRLPPSAFIPSPHRLKPLAGQGHREDPQAELVAHLDRLAAGDRMIADGKLQQFLARLVELDDRPRTQLDDLPQRLPLSGQGTTTGTRIRNRLRV